MSTVRYILNALFEPLSKSLCKYKEQVDNRLGKPNEGFHSTRFLGFSINDVIGTFGLAFILFFILIIFSSESKVYLFSLSVALMFLLGIILHRLFYVNSTLNKFIFGEVYCPKVFSFDI